MPPKAKAKAKDRGKADASAPFVGVWVYKADLRKKGEDEGWAPFDDDGQRILEENFLAGRASAKLSIKGKDYRVDYKDMLQVRVDDASLQRPVARQMKAKEASSASTKEPAAKRAKKGPQREQFASVGEEVQPQAGGRVHFSGALMHDEYKSGWCSMPYTEDDMSEYVGVGRYPKNSEAFPQAIKCTFDSVAVDAGTRVVIYSKPDFKGTVLWDRVGPAIVVNTIWAKTSSSDIGITAADTKGMPYRKVLLESVWKEPLQTIFPPEVREFSKSDMHKWNSGSLVITDGEPIPERLNEVEEYNQLDNPRF